MRAGGTILVHGDYDVDGQCATALLTRALREAGADVVGFVPHRLRDGYDFGPAGLAVAQRLGASLVITCDCGITAVETVRAARAAGIGVVVTDHHLPGAELPPALAIVDPQRNDDVSDARVLCGTGIAFKLVQALVPALGLPPNLPYHLLDLVALATVADVVPLVGENRILVRHGLRLLADSRWPGLRALVEASGLGGRELRAGHMGYVLGPRLNAVGRIGDAADGPPPAPHRRRGRRPPRWPAGSRGSTSSGSRSTTGSWRRRWRRWSRPAIPSATPASCSRATAGIRAWSASSPREWWSAMAGRHFSSRSTATWGRARAGASRGSICTRRCWPAAICSSATAGTRWRPGSPSAAAGWTSSASGSARSRARRSAPEDLGPEQRVDLELGLHEATRELERLCRHLEPCGSGNASPVFGVRGVRLTGRSRVGNGHLKGVLDDGSTRLPAIGFQWADRVPWLGDGPVDAAFRLESNEWNGHTTLQARLCALSPHAPG